MAAWQATYWLVPLEEMINDPEHAWVGIEHATSLLSGFDEVLPMAQSWAEDIRIWGAPESHDVQAFLDQGDVTGIRVRIDMRADGLPAFASAVAEVGMTLGAAFRAESGDDVFPHAGDLLESLSRSPAAVFVSNPQQWLDDLRDRAV